jgi:lipoprotein-anchoring transpeptidase ErfK/SrfK
MRGAGRSLVVLVAFFAMMGSGQFVRAEDSELTAVPEQAAQQSAESAPEQKAAQAPQQASEHAVEQKQEATAEHSAAQGPASAAKVDLAPYAPGTIVVETSERKLHLVLENGESVTYPVGVGKRGKSWAGTGAISGKFLRPAWSPPRRLKMEKPWTPNYIPGGSPSNPMGAAAMTLNVDQYAIHGTNDPGSIGGFVSFGCIRMHNRDILDLYKRVKVGTKVVVLQ